MSKLGSSRAAVGAFLTLSCLSAAPAQAAAVSYVSGKGVDSGDCSTQASPCRTFQYAQGQTLAGGEIKAVDPANYFPVTITKSISITGVEGAGVIRGTPGDAVVINAGASDVVNLTGLVFDGFHKTAGHGVRLNSGAFVAIRNCSVRNFSARGIAIFPTGATKFLIEDTTLINDGDRGILVVNDFGGSAEGAIRRVTAAWSQNGITVGNGAKVTIADSEAANNSSAGFEVSGGTLRLFHSVAAANGFGFCNCGGGSTAESAGNNFFRGNATNINGVLTNVGTQ